MSKLHLSILSGILFISLAGCRQTADRSNTGLQPVDNAATAHQVADPDTTGAALWQHLQASDYREEWELWPGKGELYVGREPHGMLLTTYLNHTAAEALLNRTGRMPTGAILVKENYMPDSTLAAITVMFKVEGYNPDHNDWFFSKFKPDGTLETAPNGMAMEGRLAGCQGCHGTVKPNDYIFTGSLTE